MSPRKKRTLSAAFKERLFAGRTPGTAVTKEEWQALGYDKGGSKSRSFTDDPIGTHKHPSAESPA